MNQKNINNAGEDGNLLEILEFNENINLEIITEKEYIDKAKVEIGSKLLKINITGIILCMLSMISILLSIINLMINLDDILFYKSIGKTYKVITLFILGVTLLFGSFILGAYRNKLIQKKVYEYKNLTEKVNTILQK